MIQVDFKYVVWAILIMQSIKYDNGAVNRFNPDSADSYSVDMVNDVASLASSFFKKHPKYWNDQKFYADMICGEESEKEEHYASLEGWQELENKLDEWFEMM